jgi:hypothetical protein
VSRMDSTPESERGRGTWRGGEIGRERGRVRWVVVARAYRWAGGIQLNYRDQCKGQGLRRVRWMVGVWSQKRYALAFSLASFI